MAGKPLNRLELRRQSEAAEPLDPMEDETDEILEDSEDDAPKPKRKAKAATKTKAKSARAAKPAARMRIVWVVMNDAYKPVGTFDFNQKEAAEARAAELTAKGKGTHFVQRTKEEIPADAPGIGALIPRPEVAPTRSRSTKAAKAAVVEAIVEDDEDVEDEDEMEAEVDDDDGDDDE